MPWQVPAKNDHSFTVLLTGSAGGGKSRCAAEMLHSYLRVNPGATGLMLRKAREWAGKSIVPFMWHTVMKRGSQYTFHKSDATFRYPNGSTLFWGGMKDDDQREALRSIGQEGGLDIVWFEEANRFTEDDFNEIVGRMRGKAGDYRQIVLSTNPDGPGHWINQRLIIGGGATVYYSGAPDNPHNPPEYIDHLNSMTGMLHQRLVLGRWVQAEGIVYDNFEPEFNVTAEADYNPAWPVIWGVDDGYARGEGPGTASYHPRVILLCQETPIGGVNVFGAHIACGELSETSIDRALGAGYPAPERVYIDSSAAELRGRIWQHGIQTISATHPVSEGIKNLRRLVCDGNGVRLLKIHPRCTELIRELQSYRYDPASSAVQAGEPKPLKVDDHGVDALRYATFHLRYG